MNKTTERPTISKIVGPDGVQHVTNVSRCLSDAVDTLCYSSFITFHSPETGPDLFEIQGKLYDLSRTLHKVWEREQDAKKRERTS